jgi:hypothetical protein
MIRRKQVIVMFSLLLSTVVAGTILNASNLPMPPIPKTLAVGIAKIVIIILPRNVHGQEVFYEFVIFWLITLIGFAILYILAKTFIRFLNKRNLSKKLS